MKLFARIAVTAAALALVGAAAGSTAKPTLKVGISGNGTVTSKPSGISCPTACTLHGHRGEKVTLTATPDSDAEFSHWSAPCGTSFTCTVKLSSSRIVHAFFKAAPAPPPPPPPPPPPAKPGHYKGTYSDGTFIVFDVGPSGISVVNFDFDFNGECPNYGSSYGESGGPDGPFPIQSDGSFQATATFAPSNSTGTVTVTGKFSSNGSAAGNASITFTFTSGDAQGVTCTSTGTWTAQDQS